MSQIYLDTLAPIVATVGYGTVGTGGQLGADTLRVNVRGRTYEHALGTHPAAQLVFDAGGRFTTMRASVAINDDVPLGRSHADFSVLADGRTVATAQYVIAGSPPREILADVRGAQRIELVVRTTRWEYSHAVWLDPILETDETGASRATAVDCLGRAEIELPRFAPLERCIATVVSPGFERRLDDLLGSLAANGGCPDARVFVFAVDADEHCQRVVAKHGATSIACRALAPIGMAVKAILYSVARIIDARQYLCLDSDMIVTGSLAVVFSALDALPSRNVLVCREANQVKHASLGEALRVLYHGGDKDAVTLEMTSREAQYPLVVNDGLFAASREALLAVDAAIASMTRAREWVDTSGWVSWRNQFVFNLALARLDAGIELDPSYNLQLREHDVAFESGRRVAASWNGRPVNALHFNGEAKGKYPELQGRYAAVARPLTGPTPGDGYATFLAALRAWIGTYGLDVLAWSFHGTSDGCSAEVRDTSTFPLLAALHYLLRSNGCVRVVETGTHRGVSSACIASAIAHRSSSRIVTFDPQVYPEREELWSSLPAIMRGCIDARAEEGVEGMSALLAQEERYDAALLDSLHTAEQVWSEFDVARRLVCAGGLILIHDALWAGGTVDDALVRIERSGYNVIRLWSAEGGVAEDDRLGLAVIENRLRRSAAIHS